MGGYGKFYQMVKAGMTAYAYADCLGPMCLCGDQRDDLWSPTHCDHLAMPSAFTIRPDDRMARKGQLLDQVKGAGMDLAINFGPGNRFKMSKFLRHGQHLGGVQWRKKLYWMPCYPIR